MGLFSGIRDAFNSVSEFLSSAFSDITEKIHDVFYDDSYDRREGSGDLTISKTPESYDIWLAEQNAYDFTLFGSDYTDYFGLAES